MSRGFQNPLAEEPLWTTAVRRSRNRAHPKRKSINTFHFFKAYPVQRFRFSTCPLCLCSGLGFHLPKLPTPLYTACNAHDTKNLSFLCPCRRMLHLSRCPVLPE